MTATLLDLNLLLALAWPSHEHHERAHRWLADRGNAKWATCPLTQLGFVRLSSNPRVVDPVISPSRAAELLRRIITRPTHVFWPDDLDLARDDSWPPGWVKGHRQVTDSRLVALAAQHAGRLATFDHALASATGEQLVELIV